ncbi:DUF488 domain-containing protein [Zhihengliuella sp.]|uniref:DUF488 domain-containing protein n=1 Tax=Zhihengliuella sp. TaxID=1954483 RepID=UPI002810A278|nr:DUF488 domain-containing protein [Zhihengliuella sp.]
MPEAEAEILTVGHSTHPLGEFVDLLQGAGATAVVDVRSLPGSNRHPQFNAESLAAGLSEHGIVYRRIAALGGRRNLQRAIDPEVNGFWQNRSFHNYADYALSEEFDGGLAELLEIAREARPAIMCSEAVWWRCHRRIIADHLLARGTDVRHLMPGGRVAPAELTRGAVASGGTVEYPG